MMTDYIEEKFEPDNGNNNRREDRREDRRHLIYYLKVENRVTGELIGRVVDITQKGILLINRDAFENKSEIPVRIELGDELFAKMHGHLELNIQCRWSKKDINPEYYVNGFEFSNQSKEQESVIQKLIDLIGFID